jgi:hypothetical protein
MYHNPYIPDVMFNRDRTYALGNTFLYNID